MTITPITTHPKHSHQYWAMLIPHTGVSEFEAHQAHFERMSPLAFATRQVEENILPGQDMVVLELDIRGYQGRVATWDVQNKSIAALSLANRTMEGLAGKRPSLFSVHNVVNPQKLLSLSDFIGLAKKTLKSMYAEEAQLMAKYQPQTPSVTHEPEKVYA